MAEPQILLQFPDSAGTEVPLVPHIDEMPPWAGGRGYTSIVGIALSRNHPDNGGLRVWPFSQQTQVELTPEAGDIAVMDPRLPHSPGVNRTGGIRYAVYFPFLQSTMSGFLLAGRLLRGVQSSPRGRRRHRGFRRIPGRKSLTTNQRPPTGRP
jgi:hypothetical protein